MKKDKKYDVVIVGGLGHVGVPLGLAFAHKGLNVCLQDINSKTASMVENGQMPFIEYGAEPMLKEVLEKGRLHVSLDFDSISQAEHVIITIGTPIDEYLNAKMDVFLNLMSELQNRLDSNQTLIIRSTIFPGTCKRVASYLNQDGNEWHVAYCPERIIQGYAIRELFELPQIVAGLTDHALEEASKLFSLLSPKIIPASVEEAEMMKLFANSWRYIQFSVSNQFYMICENNNIDFDRMRKIMTDGYPRAEAMPGSGFTAGPCLLKDTMQLSAHNRDHFLLGHAAMAINEGLPKFLVEKLRREHDLEAKKVGILGMAFKADVDDIRDSLSYKLRKILQFHGAHVICSDEFVKDNEFLSKEELLEQSDIIIIGVPHSAYKNMAMPSEKTILDLWGVTKKA